MLQQDYLMRLILMCVRALMDSVSARKEGDPDLAVERIEGMIGTAVDMDADVLLALSPESLGTILNLGDAMNDSIAEYVMRALVFEADVLRNEKGDAGLADIRLAQAHGIAQTFALEFDPTVLDSFQAKELFDDASKLPERH